MGQKKLFPILLLLVFGISTCWAGEGSVPSDNDMAIHTWGGGELLQRVFQSMSMLIYGNTKSGIDQTFNGILRIGMTVGGFCCICLAFLREKFEPLIKHFFLPGVAVMSCLLVPRTTIYIQDHLAQKTASTTAAAMIKVEKVPYFIGKLAPLVSTVSYKLTNGLERVAHGVNDRLYDWTGHIYAGENIFLTKKCRIANPVLEDNFREFCRECVFRDLGLGIYSKEALMNASNVLQFLEENTSRIRTVPYREINEKDPEASSLGDFLPCRDAIKKMNALFDKKTGNTKEILLGEIGNDFQFLLNQKAGGETDLRKLIKQQIAINLLKEEIPGTLNSFASKRAELLQKENQKILGALGANSIVAMRNFFEATIYMVFPLIILICLLSFGLKPLVNWTHFILWVNTWPPFYVVVKFLLNAIWEFRTKHTFGDSFGLTIFTSEGLADLYSSMESIAAISMAFIPFLSWILLKGGVSQMVQLASSLMSPAQTAASTTAAEKTYGNYNLGNVNLDNINNHNAQAFRQTYSGFLSSGSVSIDSGTETMTYTPAGNALYIKQSDSYLREGISRTEAFNTAVQDSLNTSQSSLHEVSKNYSENLTDSSNKAVGLVQALSKQYQTSESSNTQTTTGLQEAVQYMQGIGNDYAHARGINNDQALREVVSAGIGISLGVKASTDASYQDGSAKSEADNIMAKAFDSETFQKHLQTIKNASHGEVASVLGSEDLRLHEDFSHSFNKTLSSSDQLRAAYTEHQALSNLKSYSSSEDVRIHQNLNQRFVDFLAEKYDDASKINAILEMPSESGEKYALIQEFVNDFIPHHPFDNDKASIKSSYTHHAEGVTQVPEDKFNRTSSAFIHDKQEKIGFAFGDIKDRVEEFKSTVLNMNQEDTNSLLQDRTRIEENYNDRKNFSEEALDSTTMSRFIDKSSIIGPIIEKTSDINSFNAVHYLLYGRSDQTSNQSE
jgi:conjugal transfer mating pair stabilization protein TraG